ncbi:MAG: FG-GAP repeat protein [Nanoarchaeota archaeon]
MRENDRPERKVLVLATASLFALLGYLNKNYPTPKEKESPLVQVVVNGDLNGDGFSDIIRRTGDRWEVSYFSGKNYSLFMEIRPEDENRAAEIFADYIMKR